MAGGALSTIGLLADVLGLASLTGTFLDQDNPQAEGTQLLVKLGLGNPDDGVTGFGGNVDIAYAWDSYNTYMGSGTGPEADAGGTIAITIDQPTPDRQGRYVQITAGEDDICVLYVNAASHDGLSQGTWNGDIGSKCGQAYYHGGGDSIGTLSDGSPWLPRCSWFGLSDPHAAAARAWKFNTVAYGNSSDQTLSENAVCGATIYSQDTGPIEDEPAGANAVERERSVTSLPLPAIRPAWMEQTLVMSNISSQTAEEMCTQGMTWGPDFIDARGEYCDMETKTLTPLCTSTASNGCVIWSDDAQTISKRSSVARRTVDAVHKSYADVRRWGFE